MPKLAGARVAFLLVTLAAAHISFTAAARPLAQAGSPPGSLGARLFDLARRKLGEKLVIGGGIGYGGGGGCYGPRCADRIGTAQTLATLNAQDAVRRAVDSDTRGFGPAYYATNSAQRSATAAAWGQLGYLANQQTWDSIGYGYPYGRK